MAVFDIVNCGASIVTKFLALKLTVYSQNEFSGFYLKIPQNSYKITESWYWSIFILKKIVINPSNNMLVGWATLNYGYLCLSECFDKKKKKWSPANIQPSYISFFFQVWYLGQFISSYWKIKRRECNVIFFYLVVEHTTSSSFTMAGWLWVATDFQVMWFKTLSWKIQKFAQC